ncbi:MAG: hypothetical protein Q9178_006877 [Gyalolechia marmorata]
MDLLNSLPDYPSEDLPDDIYGDPQRLFQAMTQGNPNLPVPLFLSFQEVKRMAVGYAKDIFTAQRDLVNILDRHEDTLVKRWLKKTTIQRQKVLTTALPGIPQTHRPDFWALRKESQEQIRAGTQYRDHWLLPSLNIENLSKPRNLLLFLRSRARNPPGAFVNADANSVHLGHVAQAIMPAYLSGYTMLLAGQNSQGTYGRMISWDTDAQAFDMMSKGTGLQPGEGLQVMEIQQRKLCFLHRCAELILQDFQLKDLSVPKQPVPAHDLLDISSSEWPSLSQEVEVSAYKLPDVSDMARLQTFVAARRDQAQDHVWSLREDPSYFQEVVFEWGEHRQERLLTAGGKAHPALRQDIFWERVLSGVLMDAYTNLVAWTIVSKEIDQLKVLSASAKPNRQLPEDLAHALAHFEHLIEQLIKISISNWKVAMVASPPLRKHYVREPQDPHSTRIAVISKAGSRNKGDHLLWLLEIFLQDEQLFLCGIENVCDELEREIGAHPASRERISPYIASLISELSLLGELKRQTGLATPGPRMIECLEEGEKQTEFGKKTKLLTQIYDTLEGTSKGGAGLAQVGTPLAKFDYPSNKRRTLASTQRMQQAEKNLDIFWSHTDSYCRKRAGKTLHEMLQTVLDERQLQRTPDWVEPQDRIDDSEDSKLDTTSSEFAALELRSRTERTVTAFSLGQDRKKAKTRGVPRSSSSTRADVLDATSSNEEEDKSPVFVVSKRGFKVFSTLFYSPTEDEPPGEIPWSEFLSAMASVGFSINKLDGSA